MTPDELDGVNDAGDVGGENDDVDVVVVGDMVAAKTVDIVTRTMQTEKQKSHITVINHLFLMKLLTN